MVSVCIKFPLLSLFFVCNFLTSLFLFLREKSTKTFFIPIPYLCFSSFSKPFKYISYIKQWSINNPAPPDTDLQAERAWQWWWWQRRWQRWCGQGRTEGGERWGRWWAAPPRLACGEGWGAGGRKWWRRQQRWGGAGGRRREVAAAWGGQSPSPPHRCHLGGHI